MTCQIYCRYMLAETMKDVRKHTTASQRSKAFTHRICKGDIAWTSPEGDEMGNGSGCCRWLAAALGWNEWIKQNGHDKELAKDQP